MKWITYIAGLLMGLVSILLPEPYNKTALVIFLISFLGIIVLGHKAAFRAHELGIFGQFSSPGKVLGEKLTTSERNIFAFALFCIVGLGIGLMYKVNS